MLAALGTTVSAAPLTTWTNTFSDWSGSDSVDLNNASTNISAFETELNRYIEYNRNFTTNSNR